MWGFFSLSYLKLDSDPFDRLPNNFFYKQLPHVRFSGCCSVMIVEMRNEWNPRYPRSRPTATLPPTAPSASRSAYAFPAGSPCTSRSASASASRSASASASTLSAALSSGGRKELSKEAKNRVGGVENGVGRMTTMTTTTTTQTTKTDQSRCGNGELGENQTDERPSFIVTAGLYY